MPLRRLTPFALALALVGGPVAAGDRPPRQCLAMDDEESRDDRGGAYVMVLDDAATNILAVGAAVGRTEILAVLRLQSVHDDDAWPRHWRLSATVDGTRLDFTLTEDLRGGRRTPEARAAGAPVAVEFATEGNSLVWRVRRDHVPFAASKKSPWIELDAATERFGLTRDVASGKVPRDPRRSCLRPR